MAAFDIVMLPGLEPYRLLGLQAHLLEAVAARQSPPLLLIYTTPGWSVALGRYHLYSGPENRGGISGWRRLTGGRVVGAGEGWLGVAWILPSLGALLPERDVKLKPEQVMNRHVRGILGALRALGIDGFYPGRDAITVNRREIAMCTLEIDHSGAILFESLLAVNRGMEELISDLQRFDPAGELNCAMYGPHNATKLVRELDRDIRFAELAEALARGYSDLFGGGAERDLTTLEMAQSEHRGSSLAQGGWFNLAAPTDSANSRVASQLGAIEAYVHASAEGIVEAAWLYGDFIANSPALGKLQAELSGKLLDSVSVSQALSKIFASPDNRWDNFILGAGKLSNLMKLFMQVQ